MRIVFQAKERKKEGRLLPLISRILPAIFIWLAAAAALHASMQTIIPGGDWYDTGGNIIYATEGGILNYNGTYYLWGMDRSANNSTFTGVNLYSSPDLKNWTFVHKILTSASNTLLGGGATIERAKILYNSSTNQFVMWMHYEDHNAYNVAEVAYATCGTIGGDYTFQSHFQPMGIDSRDLNVYQDTDGKAYLICTTLGNQNVSLFALDSTYTSVVSEVFRGAASNNMACEGHAIIKSGGYYFWIMSWCSGWDFNDNHYYYATSLGGPWTSGGNIATANAHTYESQVGWAFQVTGTGGSTFIFMGDRWSVSNFSMSRMVMLPLSVNGTTLSMPWYDQWDIDTQTGTWQAGPQIVWNGQCKIINRHSGKVLDVNGGSTADSAVVDQYTDNGGANQKWTITNLGGSDYTITSVNSGKLLDISGAARTDGAPAIQYTSNGGYNQKWHIIDSSRGAGYYRLVNVNTLCKTLEIPSSGDDADGTQAALGDFSYKDYQEWQIVSNYSPTQTPAVTAVPTSTRTSSATASMSPTVTNTITWTSSVVPIASATATLTRTLTASASATDTSSVSPTVTYSATASMSPSSIITNTQTWTRTQTASGSQTPSYTETLTATSTPSTSATPSLSISATASVSPSNTLTRTPTSSASDTPMATVSSTESWMPSPTSTGSVLPSFTDSPTGTRTTTPSFTATLTLTLTATLTRTSTLTLTIPPTPTPTAAAFAEIFEITDVLNYPNPYNVTSPLYIRFNTTRDLSNIVFRLYTASFRLVLKVNEGAYLEGDRTIQVAVSYLAGLSDGTYYYLIEGTDGSGKKARGRIGTIIILK